MKQRPNAGKQQGSALIEAMAAIVIFSLGILAMIWLQASAASQASDAKYRLEASFIANQLMGQMWVNRNEPDKFVGKDVGVPGLPDGKRTVVRQGPQVTITVSWKAPGEKVTHRYETVGLIN
ncbi:hypothetical protein GTP41_25630 [Pseudoduganella sp. DS3]|uniref:Type IV pilus modification protein PilV n=1 Tax=Pseudoduganella guangdongensis TaxID=2692179 RepID=A0A6N9HP13_9BURK|nr:hypothetical protein [Pseudoduganella guangdongensis]MYN05481.1 hypothetical protein [Pseudoduganella guangdongensis]